MAQPHQIPSLFLFVVSQLSTNVINEIDIEDISDWTTLKTKLKTYYSQTKHVAQTHEELETLRQYSNEGITDFFKRVEKTKNECIQAEYLCAQPNEFTAIKKAIQRTALRRFIIHCKSEISQMLRARDIDNLNEAYNIALQEEKILNYTKHKSNNYQKDLFCNFCKMKNHTTQNCRKKSKQFNGKNDHSNANQNFQKNQNQSNSNSYNPNYQKNVCNYCKIPGHTIENCRKRQNRNNYFQNPKVNQLEDKSLNSEGQTLPNVPESDHGQYMEAFK